MASTLEGGGKDRSVTRGHGTDALGPSDTSDSGSDIRGGPGLVEGDVIGLDEAGTTSDADLGGRTAGPDIGDADLDSDSDSTGTGERRGAGRDPDEPEHLDRRADRLQGSTSSTTSPSGKRGSGPATDAGTETSGSGADTGRSGV